MSWKDGAIKVEKKGSWKESAEKVGIDAIPEGEILNERAPEISFEDRLISKNLAQNPEKQAAYLRSKYPGLEIRTMGEDVIVKSGDGSFRKLDPSTLELEDVSDVLDSAVGGVTSTLGTIGGGLAGALAGPAGTATGAILGSGAAGAGTEALRQRLGKALGIPQEVSVKDAAMAGGMNMLGAGLLGTGAIPKGETKGLIRAAWSKGAPAAARMWTGVTDDVLKAYSNPVTREGIDELATGGKTQFTDDLVQRIRAGLNREKKTVGKALGDSIDQANEMVNLSKAKAPIKNYSEEIMSSKKVLNPLDKEAADSGRSVFRQVFGDAENVDQEIPDLVSASRAFELQDQLRDFSDLRRVSGGVNPRYANNASAAEKALSDKAAESYRAVGQELDRVTSGAAPELKKQYKELIDIQDTLAPLVRTDQSAYNTFKGMDNPGKVMFKESLEKLAGKTGENYSDDIVKLQAADYFGSGSWTPKSIGGTVSTSRTVPATAIGGVIGGRIGAGFGMPYLGAAIGIGAGGASASPQALKYLIRNTDGVRAIANQAGKGMDKQYVTPVVRETLMRTPWFGVDE